MHKLHTHTQSKINYTNLDTTNCIFQLLCSCFVSLSPDRQPHFNLISFSFGSDLMSLKNISIRQPYSSARAATKYPGQWYGFTSSNCATIEVTPENCKSYVFTAVTNSVYHNIIAPTYQGALFSWIGYTNVLWKLFCRLRVNGRLCNVLEMFRGLNFYSTRAIHEN